MWVVQSVAPEGSSATKGFSPEGSSATKGFLGKFNAIIMYSSATLYLEINNNSFFNFFGNIQILPYSINHFFENDMEFCFIIVIIEPIEIVQPVEPWQLGQLDS